MRALVCWRTNLRVGNPWCEDPQYYNDGLPNMASDPSYSATSEPSRYAHGSMVQAQIGRENHPVR